MPPKPKNKASATKRKPAQKKRRAKKSASHRKPKGVVARVEARFESVDVENAERAGAEIASHLVDFQKAALDSGIEAIGKVQSQTGKALHRVAQDADWMPDEAKEVIDEWIGLAEKGRKEFKKSMDSSFRLLSRYLDNVEKGRSKGRKRKSSPSTQPRSKAKPAAKTARTKKKTTTRRRTS